MIELGQINHLGPRFYYMVVKVGRGGGQTWFKKVLRNTILSTVLYF